MYVCVCVCVCGWVGGCAVCVFCFVLKLYLIITYNVGSSSTEEG